MERNTDVIPQGSILRPLLFNNFPCDLFYFSEGTDVASAAETQEC